MAAPRRDATPRLAAEDRRRKQGIRPGQDGSAESVLSSADLLSSIGAGRWSVVIPVKRAAEGKSRLRMPGLDHEALARAIALDTIAAALACEAVTVVHVVTGDSVTARMLRGVPGIRIVPDPGTGLTGALHAGLGAAGLRADRAVLLGDLPALRPAELAAALAAARSDARGFVPDADGTGTTLATARAGEEFPVLFGPGSAAAHRGAGFTELALPPESGLRRDVDLAEHLHRARGRLGPRTAAAIRGQEIRPEQDDPAASVLFSADLLFSGGPWRDRDVAPIAASIR